MKVSIVEGTYAQIHQTLTAIGSVFITKAAIALNATPMHFTLIAGVAQFCQFFQLYAVKHNQNITSRKKPCIQFAFWGRLINLLLGVSFAIINPTLAFVFFLSLLCISATLQTISGNMWVAWMSDLIPKKIRGRFFSRRMQIHLLFGLVIGYIFSFIIDLFEAKPDTWRYELVDMINLQSVFRPEHLPLGLTIIFILGTVAGLYGLKSLSSQPEKEIKKADAEQFNILEPLKSKDFRKLIRFGIWWMFAIGIGSAFWGPFMLKVLKMSLVEMQIYSMLSAFAMLLSFRFWGMFIDKFGNKTAMKICVFLGGLNPLVWLFLTPESYALIFIEAITSGVMWSGANLISFNFVLCIAPRGKEQHWSAVYSAICGTVMLSTIMLSGIFYPKSMSIGNLTLHPEQVLFALTGILRLTAEIPLYFVHEPKAVTLRKTVGYASDFILANLTRLWNRMFKIISS